MSLYTPSRPDLRTLAAQITALPGWEWRAGMLIGSGRITEHTLAVTHLSVPDLTDPATGGVLLTLMERAEPDIELSRCGSQTDAPWCVLASPDAVKWITGTGATVGEAVARLALKRGGWV